MDDFITCVPCEFCEISKMTVFYRTPQVAASVSNDPQYYAGGEAFINATHFYWRALIQNCFAIELTIVTVQVQEPNVVYGNNC